MAYVGFAKNIDSWWLPFDEWLRLERKMGQVGLVWVVVNLLHRGVAVLRLGAVRGFSSRTCCIEVDMGRLDGREILKE